MNKQSYIYILFSKKNGTLYTGVTSDLIKRVYEHKNKLLDGFTKRYSVDKLGYYEIFGDIETAIMREKQIKAGSRQKKIALIESMNPDWNDLYDTLSGVDSSSVNAASSSVIASAAKQSTIDCREQMDCHAPKGARNDDGVGNASRNDDSVDCRAQMDCHAPKGARNDDNSFCIDDENKEN